MNPKPIKYISKAKKAAAARDEKSQPIKYQSKVSRSKIFALAPKDLKPHALLGRVGMLSELIKREIAKGNKDGEKRQSHKDKAEAMAEELASIRESIREEGLKDALKVCKNSKGKWLILDGRHRCELAKELGLETVPCTEYPESEARAIIMAAAVRRHVSKGARAYQAVTFYPEVATEAKRGKPSKSSEAEVLTAEFLATKTGVSTTTMETAIWLFKAFAEREDIRVEFEPSVFGGNALDKIKGAVQARIMGKPASEDEEEMEDPSHEKFVKCQTSLHALKKSWEVWDDIKPEHQENALILICMNFKNAPSVVRQALAKSLTEEDEEV